MIKITKYHRVLRVEISGDLRKSQEISGNLRKSQENHRGVSRWESSVFGLKRKISRFIKKIIFFCQLLIIVQLLLVVILYIFFTTLRINIGDLIILLIIQTYLFSMGNEYNLLKQ